MSEQYTGQRAEVAMTEAWKQWEGQVVNGEFHLREYMGGDEESAVFQTFYGVQDPQSATIKLVPESSPNAEDRLASWQLALSVSHPTLIQIFQTGHCQIGEARLLYAVMEYAEENLAQIVPQRPLTKDEAREMLQPALDALAYLHGKGLSHGRIKPANIMAKGDRLKLSIDRLRRAGSTMDDRSDYDPPEATSSPAGDMWSLGMTLVEILTQRLPVWDCNGQRDPEVPGTLPGPFLDIARHCLRRDPKSRWTALDVADRLKSPVALGFRNGPLRNPFRVRTCRSGNRT